MKNYMAKSAKYGYTGRHYSASSSRVLSNFRIVHDNSQVIDEYTAVVEGYDINIISFEDYLQSMWYLLNQARTDPRFPEDLKKQILKGLENCKIHSPTFLETMAEVRAAADFNPACATKVELFPSPNVPKLPKFKEDAVAPSVLKAALTCEGKFPQFNESFLTSAYAKHGVPIKNATGRSMTAYHSQLSKLASNIVSPDKQWAPEIHLSILKLADRFGVANISTKFTVDYDYILPMLNKDSSIGYLMCDFLEQIDGSFQTANGLKKRDIAEAAMDMFSEYIDSLRAWLDGEKEGPAPRASILDVEMLKCEIIWNFDFIDTEMSKDQMIEAQNKVRLFYMSSITDYILSVVCYKHISEGVRFYESAIGIKVEAGGLQVLWDIMDPETPTDEQARIIKKWKALGIDLTDCAYGQGDWSRYDQTLLALILLFVCMLAKPFFRVEKNSEINRDQMNAMFNDFCISVVQKVMYVYAYGTYEVFGCMFSGKFITSIGDTIYQMILKELYFMQLLKKYPNSELLRDILLNNFIVLAFYGDDHLAKWPKIMHKFRLYSDTDNFLADYVQFCCNEFGLKSKASEFKIYENLYGERYFDMDGNIFVENLERKVESPRFLRNTVVDVYANFGDGNYRYVDKLPYRDTREIAARLTATVKSSANPKTTVMSLMSNARLCSGNFEAWSMAKVMYDELAPLVGFISNDDWDYFKNTVGENSARRVAKNGAFPMLDVLIEEQKEGATGPGFEPKDFNGKKASSSHLYSANGLGNIPSMDLDLSNFDKLELEDRHMLNDFFNEYADTPDFSSLY